MMPPLEWYWHLFEALRFQFRIFAFRSRVSLSDFWSVSEMQDFFTLDKRISFKSLDFDFEFWIFGELHLKMEFFLRKQRV